MVHSDSVSNLYLAVLTRRPSPLLRLFFVGVAPLVILVSMVFFGPILNWLEQHHFFAWLRTVWFSVLLTLNLSGLRFAKSRNNPYLGGLYLALLVFLLLFWLLIGAFGEVGRNLKT
jgi:phosphatidylserine synthase